MTATDPRTDTAAEAVDVVVLGWKPTEVLRALTGYGARVVCVCEPSDASAARETADVDTVVVAGTLTDAAEVLAALARTGIRLTADAIVCSADEFPLVTASLVGEALGCRAWPVPLALALRDKFVQKQLVRAAGIPVAEACVVDTLAELALAPLAPPFVIKPFDEAGVRRTSVVRSTEEAEELAQREGSEHSGPWLAESFVEGGELHLDGVVRQGGLLLLSVSRYLANVMDFRTGGLVGSTTLDPDEHAGLYRRAADVATRSLRALGHTDGVFHLEVFEQDRALVFGECAGRVGGGRVDTVVQLKFGVDLHDEWARAVLALPSAVATAEQDPRTFGWVHLPAVRGRATVVPTDDEVRQQPGVEVVEMKVKPGATVTDVLKDSNARSGRVVVSGPDAAEVTARLRGVSAWFRTALAVEPVES
ncbi:hypothetical protein OU787_33680 [Kitasatospora sp. YST-16]|uniref:ATP-grasp domain-containing protein n=1 Tax=Kitasatospora sp. YST-16 TaxID=2998080 RepID=UPI002284CEB3|nr:hypothetical protein [Kitasatospora sp. YST-16]WAL76067.1 hypothetical protein OU787_33680 [Kitasatospora sp. YST-16]WNW42120.1 hypothetical protein RKE32_33570 [Streptomyces sp. Li-HN-5-13]